MSTRIVLVPGTLALLPEHASLIDPIPELRAACLAAVAWLGAPDEVLADDQGHTADWLASPGRPAIDQLTRVPHRPAPLADAVWLDGAAAWFDCRTESVHRAGDHDIVVGNVLAAEQGAADAGGLVHLRGRLRPVR